MDGVATPPEGKKGLAPFNYLIDNKMWAPSDEANQYHLTYKTEEYRKLAKELEEMHAGIKHYQNPIHQVYSKTFVDKGQEITEKLLNEQARMITGDLPLSEWDRLVKEYLDSGGAQIIEEVNRRFRRTTFIRLEMRPASRKSRPPPGRAGLNPAPVLPPPFNPLKQSKQRKGLRLRSPALKGRGIRDRAGHFHDGRAAHPLHGEERNGDGKS